MPFNDPYMLSMEFSVEAVLDNLFDLAKSHEGKFYLFADVDIKRPISETLTELDRVFKSECFIGIKLHPTNTGYPIDGTYYDEIFSYTEKKNLLLEIHSYPRESLEDDVCSPRRIKQMLEKYPKVRVSVAHMGGFQYQELLGTGVYVNMSSVLPDDVSPHVIEKTGSILRSFGIEKVVFATDYPDNRQIEPETIYERYFDILNALGFTEEELEKILGTNALTMIGKG